MNDYNEDRATAGILFIKAQMFTAWGTAAEYQANLLSELALTIGYTIERSEKDLPDEVSAPFLPMARILLDKVQADELRLREESANQFTQATQLIDRAKELSDVCEWPEVIGSR